MYTCTNSQTKITHYIEIIIVKAVKTNDSSEIYLNRNSNIVPKYEILQNLKSVLLLNEDCYLRSS